MKTDALVRLLRKKLMEGKTLLAAAGAADMSERTARKWKQGSLPSQVKKLRTWRTRQDPFSEVWEVDVLPLLERDTAGVLQAITILDVLQTRYPSRFPDGQVRSLQRRLRDWRALHGAEREVFFEQVHPAGKEAAVDFTHCADLGVTIRGEVFEHKLFEFVLAHSNWTWVDLCFSETFESLVAGLQGAVWELGGTPAGVVLDSMSAATHEIAGGGRKFNRRFQAVLDHYTLTGRRIQVGKANENGVVEQRHRRTKELVAQELVIRGRSDFDSAAGYLAFVRELVERRHNSRLGADLVSDRAALRPLPAEAVPGYTTYRCKVRCWSTIRVAKKSYSVPSRLIGYAVEARVHADVVEVLYRGRLVQTMERIRGGHDVRIDYRHVIWSLVRKPGAFAAYRYREELFPSVTFRRAYDCLRRHQGGRADAEYLRVLHLAASTMETTVEAALVDLLAAGTPFNYEAVKQRAEPDSPVIPKLDLPDPDLGIYDQLLEGGAA